MSKDLTYIWGLVSQKLGTYDFKNKSQSVNQLIQYMLLRTQSMFDYDGLPDSITKRMLELYLQLNGNACITEVHGVLYAFTGGLGGQPDTYYQPTKYVVSNPALSYTKTLDIGKDCVVIRNDSLYMGLSSMYSKYATLLMENDITMRMVDINSRILSMITADNDTALKSAEKFIKDVELGEMGVMASKAFFEGIKSQPYASSGNQGVRLTDLVEYHQYLKASWFNELGLQANYNMKRESINSSEAGLNDDVLLPLIDNMLECRQIGLNEVNEMYGTNITVKLASSWEESNQEKEDSNQLENEEVENEE